MNGDEEGKGAGKTHPRFESGLTREKLTFSTSVNPIAGAAQNNPLGEGS